MKKHLPLIRFLLIIALSALCGAAAAILLSSVDGATVAAITAQWLIQNSLYLLILSTALTLLIGSFFYLRGKKLIAKNTSNIDEIFDVADRYLSWSLILSSLTTIFGFLFFGIFASGIPTIMQTASSALIAFITIGIFLIAMFGSVFLQVVTIKLTKVLYPNKKGNPLDRSFRKDWLASCDEAEQYIIFRSAYTAMGVTQLAFLICWLIATFSALFFDTGLLPIVLITILWGLQMLSYTLTSLKLEKHQLR